MTTNQEKYDRNVEKIALEHCWAWFSLHATQRLQSVNFFLIAMAFLSAAFVTAAKDRMYLVAAGVAVLATATSYFFYRIERRIRSLLHAAEKAISPLQKRLADVLDIESLSIVDRVEEAQPGEWKYSKVFRYLYFTTGAAFALGLLYVGLEWTFPLSSAQFNTGSVPNTFSIVVQAVLGVFLLVCAYEMMFDMPSTSHKDCVFEARRWLFLIFGLACGIAGIATVYHLVFVTL
jgi:hypothetical protein